MKIESRELNDRIQPNVNVNDPNHITRSSVILEENHRRSNEPTPSGYNVPIRLLIRQTELILIVCSFKYIKMHIIKYIKKMVLLTNKF